MKPPSLFPLLKVPTMELTDGAVVRALPFCRRVFQKGSTCTDHYRAAATRGEGYSECPYGFTTRMFHFAGTPYCVTGVVAHPRFGSREERQRAKDHPDARTSRDAIEGMVKFLQEADTARADAIQTAAKILPQAFHELRKLNGAVLQHAEKELKNSIAPALLTIKSAAELMRNNFDILEALSNIEGMKALPLDATINLFDLTYKTKKVLDERAAARNVQLVVRGLRTIISGSQKSFPIVPAVLIENAIKYSRKGTTVVAEVGTIGQRAILSVDNETEYHIDPVKCFDRGTRYAGGAVEGGGFGLFLAKEIVRAHGGSVYCEPSTGHVRFTVELPLVRVIPHMGDLVGISW